MGNFWRVVDMDKEEKALKEHLEKMKRIAKAAEEEAEKAKK